MIVVQGRTFAGRRNSPCVDRSTPAGCAERPGPSVSRIALLGFRQDPVPHVNPKCPVLWFGGDPLPKMAYLIHPSVLPEGRAPKNPLWQPCACMQALDKKSCTSFQAVWLSFFFCSAIEAKKKKRVQREMRLLPAQL